MTASNIGLSLALIPSDGKRIPISPWERSVRRERPRRIYRADMASNLANAWKTMINLSANQMDTFAPDGCSHGNVLAGGPSMPDESCRIRRPVGKMLVHFRHSRRPWRSQAAFYEKHMPV